MPFRLPEAPRSGNDVATLKGVVKKYGDRTVYDGLDFEVKRGERWCVMGVNGAGKTTLLKLIAGQLEAEGGEVRLGASLQMGYFAQVALEVLDPEKSVWEQIDGAFPTATTPSKRNLLGSFDFPGDDIDKPIRVLSGGERSRLVLAQMLFRPPNFLVLDEPTNHLDLVTKEMLVETLANYEGTMIFVSHDRTFLRGLATHVLDLTGGVPTVYPAPTPSGWSVRGPRPPACTPEPSLVRELEVAELEAGSDHAADERVAGRTLQRARGLPRAARHEGLQRGVLAGAQSDAPPVDVEVDVVPTLVEPDLVSEDAMGAALLATLQQEEDRGRRRAVSVGCLDPRLGAEGLAVVAALGMGGEPEARDLARCAGVGHVGSGSGLDGPRAYPGGFWSPCLGVGLPPGDPRSARGLAPSSSRRPGGGARRRREERVAGRGGLPP